MNRITNKSGVLDLTARSNDAQRARVAALTLLATTVSITVAEREELSLLLELAYSNDIDSPNVDQQPVTSIERDDAHGSYTLSLYHDDATNVSWVTDENGRFATIVKRESQEKSRGNYYCAIRNAHRGFRVLRAQSINALIAKID